jgi:hypothetical protein
VTRSILSFVIALTALAAVPASVAWADDPAPTPAQLEKAKQAFQEGKKLHDAGKLPEAIEKFKESYNLSKNPVLLYNIGLTMEEASSDDLALIYYRKFLSDAPADAAQRAEVTDRVAAITKKLAGTTTEAAKTEPAKTEPAKTEPAKPVDTKIKAAGTYSATDFQHEAVESAPPGKPLDITAFVPEDSGFTVTLYFRAAGEAKFTSKPMKWRYKELVGRVPASKMIGSAVQYYIEVKDQAGNVVTRSGKSTSPNLINLDATATERFYPDVTDDPEPHQTGADVRKQDEEDPFNKTKPQPAGDKTDSAVAPATQGSGLADVGSNKFTYAKWGATGVAAVGVGLGVTFFILAGKQASALEEDSKHCGTPPCQQFDLTYDRELEKSGKRDQLVSNIAFGVGIAGAVVAGYFWYRELRAKKRGELKVSKATSPEASSTSSWLITPALGPDYSGAAAAVRF